MKIILYSLKDLLKNFLKWDSKREQIQLFHIFDLFFTINATCKEQKISKDV